MAKSTSIVICTCITIQFVCLCRNVLIDGFVIVPQSPLTANVNVNINVNRVSSKTSPVFPSSSLSPSSSSSLLYAGGGFGQGTKNTKNSKNKKKNKKVSSNKRSLLDTLEDRRPQPAADTTTTSTSNQSKAKSKPFVRSEQDELIERLAEQSSKGCIGQAVETAKQSLLGSDSNNNDNEIDPFWELMPSLIRSRFPTVQDHELQRVAGMVQYAIHPTQSQLDQSIIDNPWRPHDEIHAYMPGIYADKPFLDSSQLKLCQQLEQNYDTILQEYEALINDDKKDRFQSVTSMNYDSGWKTLVLFYNGHRIPDFPYHLCPTTTKILETVPLAGRIAGFNRQEPSSGIPLHSDGNNMWLTCQMGLKCSDNKAWIRVGPERRYWQRGKCLLYDTTFEHETMNEDPDAERVVLHVDFFNTLQMTPVEVEVMKYIYALREQFMSAEGVAKVGKQIL